MLLNLTLVKSIEGKIDSDICQGWFNESRFEVYHKITHFN